MACWDLEALAITCSRCPGLRLGRLTGMMSSATQALLIWMCAGSRGCGGVKHLGKAAT